MINALYYGWIIIMCPLSGFMDNAEKWDGRSETLSHCRGLRAAVTSTCCVIDVEKCQHVIVQAVGIEKAIRITHGPQRAIEHDADLIGQDACFLEIMRDKYDGAIKALVYFAHDAVHLPLGCGIKCRERLVKKQYLGFEDEGACQCRTLGLATADDARVSVGDSIDAKTREQSSTRLRASSPPILRTRNPYSTFSRTVIWGKSA